MEKEVQALSAGEFPQPAVSKMKTNKQIGQEAGSIREPGGYIGVSSTIGQSGRHLSRNE